MKVKIYDIKNELKSYITKEESKRLVSNLMESCAGNFKLDLENINQWKFMINENIDLIFYFIYALIEYLNNKMFPKKIKFDSIFVSIIDLFKLIEEKNFELLLLKEFETNEGEKKIFIFYLFEGLQKSCFQEGFSIKRNKKNNEFIDNNLNFSYKEIWDKATGSSKFLLKNRILILDIFHYILNKFNNLEYYLFLLDLNKDINIKFIYNLLYGGLKYNNYSYIPFGYTIFGSNSVTKEYSTKCIQLFNKLFLIENNFNEEKLNIIYNKTLDLNFCNIFNTNFKKILEEVYKKILIIIRQPYDSAHTVIRGAYLTNPLLKNIVVTLSILLNNNDFFLGLLFNDKKNYSLIVGLVYLGFTGLHHINGIKRYLKIIFWNLFSNLNYIKQLNYEIEESIEIDKLTFKIGLISNFILNFFLVKLFKSLKKNIEYEINFYGIVIYNLISCSENIDEVNCFILFNTIQYILTDFNYIKYKIFAQTLINLLSSIEKIITFKFHNNIEIIRFLLINRNILINLSNLHLSPELIKDIFKETKDSEIEDIIFDLEKIFKSFIWSNYIEFFIWVDDNLKLLKDKDINNISVLEIKEDLKIINIQNNFNKSLNHIDFNYNILKDKISKNLYKHYSSMIKD